MSIFRVTETYDYSGLASFYAAHFDYIGIWFMWMVVALLLNKKIGFNKWFWIFGGVYAILGRAFVEHNVYIGELMGFGAYLLFLRFILLYKLGPWIFKNKEP